MRKCSVCKKGILVEKVDPPKKKTFFQCPVCNVKCVFYKNDQGLPCYHQWWDENESDDKGENHVKR